MNYLITEGTIAKNIMIRKNLNQAAVLRIMRQKGIKCDKCHFNNWLNGTEVQNTYARKFEIALDIPIGTITDITQKKQSNNKELNSIKLRNNIE